MCTSLTLHPVGEFDLVRFDWLQGDIKDLFSVNNLDMTTPHWLLLLSEMPRKGNREISLPCIQVVRVKSRSWMMDSMGKHHSSHLSVNVWGSCWSYDGEIVNVSTSDVLFNF